MPAPSHTPARSLRWCPRGEGGFTTAELLVAIVIGAIVAGIGGALVIASTRSSTVTQSRHTIQNELNTASVQLIRDVSDGSRIRTAEPTRLAIDVVRDGACQTRDWNVAGTTLSVETVFYSGATCTGGSSKRTQAMVPRLSETAAMFTYYSTLTGEFAMTGQVETTKVSRVGWAMAAMPDHPDATTALRLESGAAFTLKGAATDGGGAVQDAKSATLSVVTRATIGKREGLDKPVLSWKDATPSVTTGWAVYRVANPEGMSETDPARTTWTQMVYIPTATPAPETMTWTDASLPDGYTAQYVVRATIASGNGPDSNQVSTGLRPKAPATLEVDGAGTVLTLKWPASVGATGYDVYRSTGGATPAGDGTFERHKSWSEIRTATTIAGGTLTWSETLVPGETRSYRVVATNRWEALAVTGSQTGTVGHGTLESSIISGSGARARAASPRDGDFVIPVTPPLPILALTSASSAIDYSTQVTWAPQPWTGGGPVEADGKKRDRTWTVTRNGAALWTDGVEDVKTRTDSGTAADGTYAYAAKTCNDSGCSAPSAAKSLLQRPAVPTCSAAPSGQTTRQVTVTSATSSSATGWQVQKVSGPSSSAMGGAKDANGARQVTFNELGHSAAHTFQGKSGNAAPAGVAGGGWSAWSGACTATTSVLAVGIADGWSDTKRIDLTLTSTGGAPGEQRIEVTRGGAGSDEGTGTKSGAGRHRWEPLRHGATYQAYASNSDGYNTVLAGPINVGTQTLATPGLSFGSVTTRSIQAHVSCSNGDSCTVGRDADGGSGSGATFDRLADGVTHTFYGRNSDGHNVVVSSAQRATPLLSVSTPTCNATRDSQYAPTTVRFSSNGSLNRTSAVASSAGTYSATATNTVTDGYNTSSRTNTCGVSVEPPPLPSSSISAKSTYSRYCSADDNSHRGFEVKATWSAEPGTTYVATAYYLVAGSWMNRTLGTSSGASWSIVDRDAVFKYVTIRATNAYGSVNVEASVQGGGCIPV